MTNRANCDGSLRPASPRAHFSYATRWPARPRRIAAPRPSPRRCPASTATTRAARPAERLDRRVGPDGEGPRPVGGEEQPRHPPVARLDEPAGRCAAGARPSTRAAGTPRASPRGAFSMHAGRAWRWAPRPNAPPGEVERDLVLGDDEAHELRGVVAQAAAHARPRRTAALAASRALALAPRSFDGSPRSSRLFALARSRFGFARSAAGGACAASRALATASRRAASITFDSLDRKCSAPCLMARAFLMPRPVLMASLSSSSRRMSSTVL